MSLTKDFYWDEITNAQSEAKLAEVLENSYISKIDDESYFDIVCKEKMIDERELDIKLL